MGLFVHQRVFTAADDATAAAQLDGPQGGCSYEPSLVTLWTLQAYLAGRPHASYEDVSSSDMEPVADLNNGQRMVLPLPDELRDQLAVLRGWRAWRALWFLAAMEEVKADRLTLRHVQWTVKELRREAREAVHAGRHLYFWVDVDPIALLPRT